MDAKTVGSSGLVIGLTPILMQLLHRCIPLPSAVYGPVYATMTTFVTWLVTRDWESMVNTAMLSTSGSGRWLLSGIGYLSLFGLLLGAAVAGYFYWESIRRLFIEETVLWIRDTRNIQRLSKYMNQHPERFPGFRSASTKPHGLDSVTTMKRIADDAYFRCRIDAIENMSPPECGQNFRFTDRGVEGSICWFRDLSTVEDSVSDKRKDATPTKHNYPIYSVRMSSRTASIGDLNRYLSEIEQWSRDRILQKRSGLTLLPDEKKGLYTHYKDLAPLRPGRPSDGFESFFHPERDRIWIWAKTVAQNPEFYYDRGQPAFCGILAYGPPGTGKSILTDKLAAALGRFPMVVDLSMFETKKDAYQVLEKPIIHGVYCSSKNVVISLDELDMTITKLNEFERITRELTEGGLKRIQQLTGTRDPDSSTGPEKSSESKTTEPTVTLKESDERAFQKTVEAALEALEITRNRLVVKDLLTIIQGPIPNQQMIVTGSTNYPEVIEKACPPLVRPGRLTPILFDYPGQVVVDQICEYFFKQPLGLDIPQLRGVPTSLLTSKATEFELMQTQLGGSLDDAHADFQRFVEAKIEQLSL